MPSGTFHVKRADGIRHQRRPRLQRMWL